MIQGHGTYRLGGPVDLSAHGMTGRGVVTAIRPGDATNGSVVYVRTDAGYLHLTVQNSQIRTAKARTNRSR